MSENIIVHEGRCYRTIARKAEAGELVLTVKYSEDNTGIKQGDVLTCSEVYRANDGSISVKEHYDGFFDASIGDKYFVLEPLEEPTVDTSQASPEVIDMLANLARRVTQLESQLAATQRNVERHAEELENAKHRISKHATMFGIVEENVNRLTDDVITISSLVSPKESEEETITLPKWWVEILMKHAGGVRP